MSRRVRAPTITIDTSAVGAPSTPEIPLEAIVDEPQSPQHLSVPPAVTARGNSFESGSSDTYAVPPSQGDSTTDLISHEDPLKPDPGTEQDFQVDDNKFAFTPGQLAKLINPKSLAAFRALGGLSGLAKGLRTDIISGLSVDESRLDGQVTFDEATATSANPSPLKGSPPQGRQLTVHETSVSANKDSSFADRKRIFSDNRLPERKSKSLLQLMWMAYNDKVLILLSIAAVVSLAIGIYQSIDTAKNGNGEAPVEWVEGVAIMVAIFIVVIVGSINDWQKERQFVKLNKKKEDRYIKVIRSGKTQELSVYDILVGDIVVVDPGDIIPVDGIFIDGHNVKCDESSATGESDLLRKTPAADVFGAMETNASSKNLDPFMLSGAKVTEGVGKFLTTATGIHSAYGKTMMSLRDEGEVTPLQSKLNVLATYIAKLGGAAALLYFVVAFIEFLVRITHGSQQHASSAQKGQEFLNVFIIAVSIIVVAVPEGLPLAVTLALAFATTRMLKDNNLVRLLRSCETMGVATTVCSDKTGTLTQNKMSVVAATLGTSSRFGDRKGLVPTASQSKAKTQVASSKVTASDPPTSWRNNQKQPERGGSLQQAGRPSSDDVTAQEMVATLNSDVKELLKQSIALNSSAFEAPPDAAEAYIGSKTETALLYLARDYLGLGSVGVERSNAQVEYLVPFDSSRKWMATVVKLTKSPRSSGQYRIYVKGASEILLARCTRIIDDPTRGISDRAMSGDTSEALQHLISSYASRSLRTIALTYKDFESWPPKGVRKQEEDPSQLVFDDLLKEMIFLGVVGIQDPLRVGVTAAVADCHRAGVFVRMVTGDNVETARAIATECGIYTEGGVVMEGPDFRKLGRIEMDKMLPRLQVLARSSPDDKRILVKRLKALGETVAVTGDGTNDAPALKAADVGFSMGITGTEVAKEASAIILMDDNFASIVKALLWGRAVNDAVKKFLQFQVTVNITAVIVTFVSGVASQNPVLTAVQLLWVNLIMDTFAALALATDPPSPSMLDRKPDRKNAPLISPTMWKMIIGQAIYQLVVVFVLFFRGAHILGYSDNQEPQLRTLIFNTFVWMQIFNAFNNRRLDNHFNIFEGLLKNWFFIGIIAIMIGGQIMIIFVGGAAIGVVRLNAAQWGYSLVLGAITILIGVIIRLIPDEVVMALLPEFVTRMLLPTEVVEDEEAQRYQWNPALQEIREELLFLKKFKGGRLNNLKFKMQHPRLSGFIPSRPNSVNRSRSNTNTTAQVAAAGIIAGSIAGWSPAPIDKDQVVKTSK